MPESHRHGVVNIFEENDNDGVQLSRVEQLLLRLKNASRTGQSVSLHFIDPDPNEETQISINDYEGQLLNELEQDERVGGRSFLDQAAPLRNPSFEARREIPSFRHNNMFLRKNTIVEVSPRPYEQYCWQFLQIHSLYEVGRPGNVVLLGTRLTRTRHLRGMLPRMKNEVCALYEVSQEDNSPEEVQSLVEIPVSEVTRIRTVHRTNAAFPKHRFHPADWNWDIKTIEEKAHLVQRWNFYRYWPSNAAKKIKRSYSGALVRLRSTDIADEQYRIADDKLRNEFRGGIIRGGSSTSGRVSVNTIDFNVSDGDNDDILILGHDQKYTVDDMFCGAGGASCGCQQAGLKVRYACDFDETACKTHRRNFPRALLRQMDIFEFAVVETSPIYSDFLHISPPCQVFSPAHTHTGQNDEANVAALFSCGKLLNRRRARISTGEQTFGLLFDRNEEYFNALVGQYTELGYSFRWDILRFGDYGIASTRRRLIWIASCPGEPLPLFPAPTHSNMDSRLPAPVTLQSVLDTIPRGSVRHDRLHNVSYMESAAKNSSRFPRRPYSADCQVGTITTAGSEWVHPSGRRDFTPRELACIQGFPRQFKFEGGMTQIRRQIGNAFPPTVVEILYRHLKDCILREDRVVTSQPRIEPETIMIDDSDDEMPLRRRGSVYHRDQSIRRPSRNIWTSTDLPREIEMVDLTNDVEDRPPFSRESSRTLSVESLPSLMELDIRDYERSMEIRREYCLSLPRQN